MYRLLGLLAQRGDQGTQHHHGPNTDEEVYKRQGVDVEGLLRLARNCFEGGVGVEVYISCVGRVRGGVGFFGALEASDLDGGDEEGLIDPPGSVDGKVNGCADIRHDLGCIVDGAEGFGQGKGFGVGLGVSDGRALQIVMARSTMFLYR